MADKNVINQNLKKCKLTKAEIALSVVKILHLYYIANHSESYII